jgi:enterochelin esterase-like enzyme
MGTNRDGIGSTRNRINLLATPVALLFALLGCLLLQTAAAAQEPAPPDPCVKRVPLYKSYADFHAEITAIAATLDPRERAKRLDRFWNRLRSHNQIPFAIGDRVAFLFRGEANSVEWRGDLNAWGSTFGTSGDVARRIPGTRVPGTDLWINEQEVLPEDARVDYKVVLNSTNALDGQWILDPANPLVAWSGFGPNSELRMPGYKYPYEAVAREEVPKGALTGPFRIHSAFLNYDLQYMVYLPYGYAGLSNLPTMYVTDGHEYSPDHLGSLKTILDNSIAEGSVEPTIVVFIDARNPDNLCCDNRRMTEYAANPLYLSFVADELVPRIDSAYRTRTDAASRGILGTSMGGLNAAYFGAMRPDTFLNIGAQSAAFWVYPPIYLMYERPPAPGMRIYLTQGTINDGDGGPRMKERLDRWGYTYVYVERNEGHAWAHWRALLTGMMRYFYPGPVANPPATTKGDVCG